MKALLNTFLILFTVLLVSCGETNEKSKSNQEATTSGNDKPVVEKITLTLDQANTLVTLPLECVQKEFPNKLGQTLGSEEDLAPPQVLHPAFYGCFDWHSAVHGNWSMVRLLKEFPNLDQAERVKQILLENMSEENITGEVTYFEGEHNKNYERTYGWGWLLKLAEEIHTWDDPLARQLESNLQPLTQLIAQKFIDYLPKLQYPVRVGTHTNTAFALSFAWDYAHTLENTALKEAIEQRALDFYKTDVDCPLTWEPSGADFLSPCFEEADLIRRILGKQEFLDWAENFLPGLQNSDFKMDVALVGDRKDGQLVHLDGLNFSRAWVLYGLAKQYPEEYGHVLPLANEHLAYSFPNLIGDDYEGGHWLGSFAIYALGEQ
ncbi:DUF2891 domain-containing protein [Flagellimonas nanhaiensis]|uniref:DUF2891 domain-containing protein n=1 Tax=Flagellimonas nanhaiensis TaxID=2292706 RepID=A0A371JS00_9FLAO|nr:DUF2891 domain-containing protein [Allomuricauda nanhaiensis]RDY60275.1 DUF2891 domain-containing protein [Allomuricauda nanhaiensis]